jgi:FkbM family methyltransferase
MFQWLSQTWSLPSGVGIRISRYGDWIIYNEIFVNGEYDAAIRKAIETSSVAGTFRVLDLGANTGFFALRCVDQLRRYRSDLGALVLTLVEAHPLLIEELRIRVTIENHLSPSDEVRIIHGLVGERVGEAIFYDCTVFPSFPSASRSGPRVRYVDLDRLLASDPKIDLLKCDIEGAELSFIRNYGEILRKTRVAVFELHHDTCDTALCRKLLKDLGFDNSAILRHGPLNSIYCVWR